MKIRTIVWGLAGVIVFSSAARSQSLADVARKEAERRKTIETPSKVYTDADLRRYPTVPPPEPQSANATKGAGTEDMAAAKPAEAAAMTRPEDAAATAKAVEPSVDLGEQYWRKLITDARSALARSTSYLVALQERLQALTTQFYALDDPAQRNAIANQRNKVADDIDHLKQDMAEQQKAIEKIETDARKASIPPGWIR